MGNKYLALFDVNSGQYYRIYKNKEELLNGIQGQQIKDIIVFEIVKEIKLKNQPSIILDEGG